MDKNKLARTTMVVLGVPLLAALALAQDPAPAPTPASLTGIFDSALDAALKNLDVTLILPNFVIAVMLRPWLGESRLFAGDRYLLAVFLIGAASSGLVEWNTANVEWGQWWRKWLVGSSGAVMIFQAGKKLTPDWFLPGVFGTTGKVP